MTAGCLTCITGRMLVLDVRVGTLQVGKFEKRDLRVGFRHNVFQIF